jgi:hypothetical protein
MKEELKKELEEISPFLLTMKEKTEPLSVPNHFFNNMRVDIMNKVKTEQQEVVTEKSWFFVLKTQIQSLFRPQLAFGLASACVIVIVGCLFFFKNASNSISDSCNNLTCISDEETTEYVSENIDDFDEKTLWETAYEQDENSAQAAVKSSVNENAKLKNASPEELDEMVDEMLKNGEINEDEL